MMLFLLHLDSDRMFLETGFLFRYAGLERYGYQSLVEKKELNGTTDLEFFDLAFLVILELCHVTFEILTFHLRSGLLIFRSLYGGLQVNDKLLGFFDLSSNLRKRICNLIMKNAISAYPRSITPNNLLLKQLQFVFFDLQFPNKLLPTLPRFLVPFFLFLKRCKVGLGFFELAFYL